jgi:hypothetical protein
MLQFLWLQVAVPGCVLMSRLVLLVLLLLRHCAPVLPALHAAAGSSVSGQLVGHCPLLPESMQLQLPRGCMSMRMQTQHSQQRGVRERGLPWGRRMPRHELRHGGQTFLAGQCAFAFGAA